MTHMLIIHRRDILGAFASMTRLDELACRAGIKMEHQRHVESLRTHLVQRASIAQGAGALDMRISRMIWSERDGASFTRGSCADDSDEDTPSGVNDTSESMRKKMNAHLHFDPSMPLITQARCRDRPCHRCKCRDCKCRDWPCYCTCCDRPCRGCPCGGDCQCWDARCSTLDAEMARDGHLCRQVILCTNALHRRTRACEDELRDLKKNTSIIPELMQLFHGKTVAINAHKRRTSVLLAPSPTRNRQSIGLAGILGLQNDKAGDKSNRDVEKARKAFDSSGSGVRPSMSSPGHSRHGTSPLGAHTAAGSRGVVNGGIRPAATAMAPAATCAAASRPVDGSGGASVEGMDKLINKSIKDLWA